MTNHSSNVRRIAMSGTISAVGAAFILLVGVCVSVVGQTSSASRTPRAGDSSFEIGTGGESEPQDSRAVLSGMVVDINGAAVPGARITLTSEGRKEEEKASSTNDGKFLFSSLEAGSYTLKVERLGFKPAVIQHISVHSDAALRVNAILEAKGGKVEMGMLFDSSLIDLSSTSVTTTIQTDDASKLPIP
jgi:hypothetical protein